MAYVSRFAASLLGGAALCGIGAVGFWSWSAEPNAHALIEDGYFVAMGENTRFDVLFQANGQFLVDGDVGSFVGSWDIEGDQLCVRFEDGPRAGRWCELIHHAGSLSMEIGDSLFFAKLDDLAAPAGAGDMSLVAEKRATVPESSGGRN